MAGHSLHHPAIVGETPLNVLFTSGQAWLLKPSRPLLKCPNLPRTKLQYHRKSDASASFQRQANNIIQHVEGEQPNNTSNPPKTMAWPKTVPRQKELRLALSSRGLLRTALEIGKWAAKIVQPIPINERRSQDQIPIRRRCTDLAHGNMATWQHGSSLRGLPAVFPAVCWFAHPPIDTPLKTVPPFRDICWTLRPLVWAYSPCSQKSTPQSLSEIVGGAPQVSCLKSNMGKPLACIVTKDTPQKAFRSWTINWGSTEGEFMGLRMGLKVGLGVEIVFGGMCLVQD